MARYEGFSSGYRMKTSPKTKILTYDDPDQLKTDWLALQNHGLTTMYQSYEWCVSWLESAGKKLDIIPHIIAGYDHNNNCLFILPFQLRKTFGLTQLEWLTMPMLTYGFGVYNRNLLEMTPDLIEQSWGDILAAIGPVDTINLGNIPIVWNGTPHPLAFATNITGANVSYRVKLQHDYDAIYNEKHSSSTRRGHRKRDKKLEANKGLRYNIATDKNEIHNLLDDMFTQKKRRLAASGIHGVYNETWQEFIHHLADQKLSNNRPILQLSSIKNGNDIIAIFLGGTFNQSYWGLISSLNETNFLPLSPGNYGLRKTIEYSCKQGFTSFDLADGEANYKRAWADQVVELRHICQGLSLKGKLAVSLQKAKISIKRLIKSSPRLNSAFKHSRRILLSQAC